MTLNEFIEALQHAKDVHGGNIQVKVELEHAVLQEDVLQYTGFCALEGDITLYIGIEDDTDNSSRKESK